MIPDRKRLAVGTMMGRYQIRSFVGAGGMGDVYRARDTKLDRDVALKVLPKHLSEDRGQLIRTEREAKLLAALSHANIASIYDVEESEGLPFLILEFVEGQTLAERLKQGPLSRQGCIRTFQADHRGAGSST
jgi:serine/threonine protein kinase